MKNPISWDVNRIYDPFFSFLGTKSNQIGHRNVVVDS